MTTKVKIALQMDTLRVLFLFASMACGVGCGAALRWGEYVAASLMFLGIMILFIGRAIFEAILTLAQQGGEG